MKFLEFVIITVVFCIFCICVPFCLLIVLLNYCISTIGKIEVHQNIIVKKKWKKFNMEFSALLASFGIAFFIFAHLQFIPIADRMMRNHEKVKEKTEKGKKFCEKDNSKFRRWTGFPRQRVFAT